jgi:hypothetical protein
MSDLDERLTDRELNAWLEARFCHWVGCTEKDADLMEQDHVYELVNYAKLLDAIHYFKTSFGYPYKLAKFWVICSGHHSKATQMRIRGEVIEYPERLQVLIDEVILAGKELVARTQWELEDFRMPEVAMRQKVDMSAVADGNVATN